MSSRRQLSREAANNGDDGLQVDLGIRVRGVATSGGGTTLLTLMPHLITIVHRNQCWSLYHAYKHVFTLCKIHCVIFTTYVQPLLELNTQVCIPWLHHDINSIENVQCFFTRAVHIRAKLSYMDYGTWLRNLNLQSLEYCRIFFDLVMYYKHPPH